MKGELASLTKLERGYLRRRVCGFCEASLLSDSCYAYQGKYTLPVIEGVREQEEEVDLGPPCDMVAKRAKALEHYHPRPSRQMKPFAMTAKGMAELTQDGRLKDIGARWGEKVEKRGVDECWPWRGSLSAKGYGRLKIGGRLYAATRLALMISGQPQPLDKPYACHSCDNPICCNPQHLWWGSHAENTKDSVNKGRHNSVTSPDTLFGGRGSQPSKEGSRRGGIASRSLELAQIHYIRLLGSSGISQREIARRVGTSLKTVWSVLRGNTYGDVV